MFTDLLPIILGAFSGLAVGLGMRLVMLRRLEGRAWGTGRTALSWADRREIHRAVRKGQPVGRQALAVPAILFGEQVESSIRKMPSWRRETPRGFYIFGRIFFPALGTMALVLGITEDDIASLISGVVLLAFTLLYLPVTERWTKARMAQRETRLRASIDANRLLSTNG